MAKVLEISYKQRWSLIDSDTGKKLKIEKVVDITEDCPEKIRTILYYTKAKRGRLVKITQSYSSNGDEGLYTYFFVDGLETWMNMSHPNDTFGMWADMAGLSKVELRAIIEKNAPN
jgi:hypothetical protein